MCRLLSAAFWLVGRPLSDSGNARARTRIAFLKIRRSLIIDSPRRSPYRYQHLCGVGGWYLFDCLCFALCLRRRSAPRRAAASAELRRRRWAEAAALPSPAPPPYPGRPPTLPIVLSFPHAAGPLPRRCKAGAEGRGRRLCGAAPGLISINPRALPSSRQNKSRGDAGSSRLCPLCAVLVAV